MNIHRAAVPAACAALSAAAAYAAIALSPYAFAAVIASIPLAVLRKRSLYAGLVIGFAVPLSLYAFYPLQDVSRLGAVISSISSMPYAAVLLLYPLVFALIMGLSALLWSEVYARLKARRASAAR